MGGEEGDVRRAVIVRTRKEIRRTDGTISALTIMLHHHYDAGEPVGTRIFGQYA